MTEETVSLGLPKGDVMKPLATLFKKIDFPICEYHSGNRTYRPKILDLPVRAKIMAEKDIALQVAVGNYDVGFCSRDWIMEHVVKYKASNLHVFRHLTLARKNVFACSGQDSGIESIDDVKKMRSHVTLVSEYPNLAKQFAIDNRLRKFKVFSAWGSVEGYPPEHADVVILAAADEQELAGKNLHPLSCEFESTLCLVINKDNFKKGRTKKFAPVFKYFSEMESDK